MARKRQRGLQEEWWRKTKPARYTELRIPPPSQKPPPELTLKRATLHRLLAERSGHGDFEAYHVRFGHEDYTPCRCGAAKAVGHFAVCPKALEEGPKDRKIRRLLKKPWNLIGKDWKEYARWVEASGAYKPQ